MSHLRIIRLAGRIGHEIVLLVDARRGGSARRCGAVASLLPGVRFLPAQRRARLFAAYDIDLVIDVGANSGQYAAALRGAGYAGRMASFEPLAEPYRRLLSVAATDPWWDTWRIGLGRIVSRETINIERLDDIWPQIVDSARRPYLKIDTQGYELEVLHGGTATLGAMALVEAELSLVSTYDDGPLFDDVVSFLAARGFSPIAFEGVLDDPVTGEMLQVDAIFRSA